MLEIEKEIQGDTIILKLLGQLTLTTSNTFNDFLKQLVTETPCQNILMECSDIALIDSSGIAAIITGLKRSRQASKHFSLCSLSSENRQIFKVTELDSVLKIYDSIEEAIADNANGN